MRVERSIVQVSIFHIATKRIKVYAAASEDKASQFEQSLHALIA